MDGLAWILVTLIVVLLLVPVGFLLGRGLWTRIEPGDDDPGGRESPPPMLDPNSSVFGGTPFVEVLREGRRLKQQRRGGQKRDG